jgi:hypothetical protein
MNKRIQDAISRVGEEACIMAYYFNVKQGEGGTFIETNTGSPNRSQGAAIAAGEYLMKSRKSNPIIKPMKLKPGQRSRVYVAPVRLTQEEMKKRSAAHIEKMRAYRASRGWKEKVPNEQGRYTFGKRRPKSDSGEYRSFGAWTSAVRRAGGVPQSELSEPQGAHNRNTGQIIGVWDGSSGSVYRNNPVRQRIAVSLSRSQVRRNPFNYRNLDA